MYFLSDSYQKDINRVNVDGTKGELAFQYAELVTQLWLDVKAAVSPLGLKQVLGRLRPEYAGFQQHDAHELVEFILDKVRQ